MDLKLSRTQRAIVCCLLYFDCFNHPLKLEEIHNFIQLPTTNEKVKEELLELLKLDIVKKIEKYYYIFLDNEDIQRRKDAELRFTKSIDKGLKYGRRIAAFPFVRGVYISGSMSKGVQYENGDVDYFILTAPNKVWQAKLLLVLYKRLVLFGNYEYFCINYFLDVNHSELTEKNIYTATELVSLMPVYGEEHYKRFLNSNSWATKLFPNSKSDYSYLQIKARPKFIKTILEKMLNNCVFDLIADRFMKMVRKKYINLFSNKLTKGEILLMFKSVKHESKVHYGNHQSKLISKFNSKKSTFDEMYGTHLGSHNIIDRENNSVI